MLIDWFTVIAQVINFLILAWLLKRFLYRPILNAIDAREQRIATELADADKKSVEAEQQRDEFVHKNAAFDAQLTTRINQQTEEVKAERARLFEKVRRESDDLREKLQLALKNEQLNLQSALSQRTQEEVFNIARKTLNDLAETSLEERMTSVFIKRLQLLNVEQKAAFKSAFQALTLANKTPLIVRTAFTLPNEQCALIETAIKECFGYVDGDAIAFQFLIDSAVVSGIEISANGQKIAWSINDYLTSLAKGVDQILQSLGQVHNNVESKEQSHTEVSNESNLKENNEIINEKSSRDETVVITQTATANKSEKGSHET
jgi:F-type H+-transporting ATPase subunit b